MISVLIAILVAALAYWLLVPLLGLPAIVGIVAAILVLIAGIGTGGLGRRSAV
ncbi:MAG TPA: hypothetical protein VIL49_09745 [Capillimicrobium sp.]|jgi:hypothetical protein